MKLSFFYIPKPKKFEYKPRFYDPEKEELEKLKKKYSTNEDNSADKERLEYYKEKIRLLEQEKSRRSILSFGKKKFPKFNYQPRFYKPEETVTEEQKEKSRTLEFKKPDRYVDSSDRHIPLFRILLFIGICILLLLWIFL